jgi:hypothetical protein
MSLNYIIKTIIIIIVLVLLSGCIKINTVINVKKDGTGTIELSMIIKKEVLRLNSLSDSTSDNGDSLKNSFSKEELVSLESTFGEGVKLISYNEINDEIYLGGKGIYSFSDITKVNTSTSFPDDTTSDSNSTNPIRYEFKNTGKTRILTIKMPEVKNEKKSVEQADANSKELMNMMKIYFRDLSVSFIVNVDGKIKKTNSKNVSGSAVTLMNIDLNSIISNDELFMKFYEDSSRSSNQIWSDFKNVKGMFYEDQKSIDVEFE